MSIPFNDTSTQKGLVQFYELEIGANPGDVSSNPLRLKQFTASVNLAIDDFTQLAHRYAGRWQAGNFNATKYGIIFHDLEAGRRDYKLTVDEDGKQILNIHKVLVAPTSDLQYSQLESIDLQSDNYRTSFNNGAYASGTPTKYDKTENSILFNMIPTVTVTDGIMAYVDRESTYFTDQDTSKVSGFPGTLDKYFFLKPAMDFTRRNDITRYKTIQEQVIQMEGSDALNIQGSISEHFGRRQKDERTFLSGKRYYYGNR